MSDVQSLANAIRSLAVNAVNNEVPCDVVCGVVKSENPLEIAVCQKLLLTKNALILTKNLTDFEVEITIDEKKQKITVHNALKTGEKVIMVRIMGGQQYVIIDRW